MDAAYRGLRRAPRRCGWYGAVPYVQSSNRLPTDPTYLSSDHDPLYRFHQWQANLRILEVEAIKAVPYVPLSHPFVERLIGTIRRECLDPTLFWTAGDLEMKLLDFQRYYNAHRAHAGLGGLTPEPRTGEDSARASVREYRWQRHCRGLYQTPIAA
jgi:putative transposase